ncbi:bifunctional diaminohydroxyphosphoribosylaminopyrimidine deaminase/5-amino-6-(5-phosphoribosylamino)uracil reductase RibD [Ramlibacter sp. AN1015]|uniref:bifunctional diaminohydroxyphosphoribosylaminopyrimidine deaminase/5-amino-6-(5-phosphoribosylamino)uracil reductase RibD n=1 Tax=Ramlibacter sp. AN1015 TaxID=3133428 RepID=UPI0030BA6C07
MAAALALAERSLFLSSPNPHVGCVLVDAAGRVLGEGFTQAAGSAHAEVMALRDAQQRGNPVAGATAYVTLEPCAHTGRTGPCCDALVAAGVARVVASLEDPNPLVAGRGFERLRTAGVAVEVGPGAAASRQLNIGFFSRMRRGTPWVRMKVAASLDGTTALDNGASQWITSEAARTDGHAWRARACAVLTGIGTVLEDDPRLDVRLPDISRQPRLVVVDSRLELPLEARLFEPQRELLVYTASTDAARRAALQARGATVVTLPGPGGKVDLAALLADLGRREVNELHVEAGHKLNGSLVREHLVDEFLVYLAPRLLGPGRGMAAIGPLRELAQGPELAFHACERIGPDLRILARVAGRDSF